MLVVLVTGCSGGIGQAICRKFFDKRWYVVGLDINEQYNKDVLNQFYRVDLQVEDEIKGVVDNVMKSVKRIDCVVNCAALQICKTLVQTTLDDFKRVLGCNLLGPFMLTKECYPHLVKTEGCVVNIGSVHSQATSKGIGAYATSKAGLAGMTRNMALEFAQDGVRVNCVSPGAIDTDMLRDGLGRTDITMLQFERKHPMGRIGQTVDVANMVYFLADKEKSRNITGVNYMVDGGVMCRLATES